MNRKTKSRAISDRDHRFKVMFTAFLACLGLVVYFGGLSSAVQLWSRSPDEQHGFLVVPIALLLLYLRRDQLPGESTRIDYRGCLLLAIAASLRVYGDTCIRPWMEMWSLPLWVGGVVLLFGGWHLFRWALPSIAFLFFMAPMPGQMQTVAGFPLQVIAATGGGWLLQMLGQPAFVSGTMILLGEHVLEVERACAGLRMFQGMLAVSIAWSLFSRYSWRRLLGLFAIAPLVAIFVNILRIAVTGMLLQFVNGDAAKSFTHDWAGILMIPTGAFVYFCIDTIVDRLRGWNNQNPERWLFTASMIAGGVLLISFAGYTIQKRQQRAAIDLVLIQARELKNKASDQDLTTAYKFYEQYLSARPKDAQAISEFAFLSQGLGPSKWMQAAGLYELAWRTDSIRTEDAIQGLKLLRDCSAWKTLWEKSDELIRALSGAIQIDAMRLRTLAIAQLNDGALVIAGIDKTLRGCREGMEKDYEYLDHTWQCARITRLQTSGDAYEEPIEKIVAMLPDAAKTQYPFSPERMEQEKSLRSALKGPTAQALTMVDKWIATHPDVPMPLLYRIALLQEITGKPSDELSNKQSIENSIDSAVKRALDMVDKGRSSDSKNIDASTASKVYFIAGQREMDRGDRQRAKALLDRSKELQPKSYQVYVLLGKLLQPDALEERVLLFEEGILQCGPNELAITLPLAEAYIASGRDDEAQKLLSPFQGKIDALSKFEGSKIALMLASTRASGLTQQKRTREAIETLEKTLGSTEVLTQRRNLAGLYADAQFKLARLYRSFNRDVAARAAFQEGSRFDEKSAISQLDAATAFENEGNFKAAIDQYNRAAKLIGNQEPGIYLAIARCQLALQNRVQPPLESLQEVRRTIRDARARGADIVEACVLMAESYVIANDLKTALKVVDEQLSVTSASRPLLSSRAIIRQLSGDHAGALSDVEGYVAAKAEPSDSLLLKVMIWERDGEQGNLERASSEIEAAANQFKPEDLKAAKIRLALSYLQKGQTEEAKARLASMASFYRDDRQIQRLAAELFGSLEMDDELKAAEENLIRIEGEDGTQWRMARAARLLRSNNGNANFEEAEKLISRLEQLLPDSPRTLSLRGQMSDRKGQLLQALDSYEKAWSLGLRDASLASNWLRALYRTGQNQKAGILISQLDDLVPNSSTLFSIAMPQLVQSKTSEYVEDIARKWDDDFPNYDNHVLLGRTLMAIAKSRQNNSDRRLIAKTETMLKEAEKKFEDAIQLDPTGIDAWVASFQLQVENLQNREGAIAKLERLAKELKTPPFKRSLTLARLYNVIGEGGRAGMYFDETLRLAENEPSKERDSAILEASQFFSSRRIEKSIQLYRGLIADPKSADEPAKTRLVATLAQERSKESLDEAIEIHNAKCSVTAKSETSDKLLYAKLLAARADLNDALLPNTNKQANSESDRQAAIALLKDIKPTNAEIAGLLADLYAATGQLIPAFNSFRESLQLDAAPDRMIRFLHFWNNEFAIKTIDNYQSIADQYLNQLKQKSGYSSEWLRLSIERAMVQKKTKRNTEVATQASPDQRLVDLIGEFYNSFIATSSASDFTNSIHDLALGLSRAGKNDLIPYALEDISQKLRQSGNTARLEALPSAIAAATIRLSSNAQYAGRLALWLQEHFPSSSLNSAIIARELGDAIYISGTPELAVDYYRRAIKNDPSDVNSVNNLAAALAEVGAERDEAIKLSDRAIELDPQNLDRKDTKLVVAILLKDWEIARSLSKELSDQFVGTVLLHRAFVAAEADQREESKVLFDRSRDANVERNLVVPSDKQMYQRLAEKFLKAERLVRAGSLEVGRSE